MPKIGTSLKIGATKGFPEANTSDTLSGVGSVVIPDSLIQSVRELHEFLFPDLEYEVSSTVTAIDRKNKKSSNSTLELLIQMSKDIVGDFYSFGSGNIFVEKQSNKFPEKVISHGKVTSVEASKARLMGNILLSIGNKNVTQIPSKTFEYISTGKSNLAYCRKFFGSNNKITR